MFIDDYDANSLILMNTSFTTNYKPFQIFVTQYFKQWHHKRRCICMHIYEQILIISLQICHSCYICSTFLQKLKSTIFERFCIFSFIYKKHFKRPNLIFIVKLIFSGYKMIIIASKSKIYFQNLATYPTKKRLRYKHK